MWVISPKWIWNILKCYKRNLSVFPHSQTHTRSLHKYTAELQKSGSISNSFQGKPHMDIPWWNTALSLIVSNCSAPIDTKTKELDHHDLTPGHGWNPRSLAAWALNQHIEQGVVPATTWVCSVHCTSCSLCWRHFGGTKESSFCCTRCIYLQRII